MRRNTMSYFGTCSASTLAKPETTNRRPNQDAWLLDYERGVMAVFDGVGGSWEGHEASGKAKTAIAELAISLPSINERRFSETGKLICDTLLRVNEELVTTGHGSQTTASVIVFCEDLLEGLGAVIVNVGDSRIYAWTNNGTQKLIQLTQDDSAFPDPRLDHVEVESQMTKSMEMAFRFRNVITKALGDKSLTELTPTVVFTENLNGFLLTTDGVHDNLSHAKLFDTLLSGIRGWVQISIADKIVGVAKTESDNLKNLRHKNDDITAVVIPLHKPE